MPSSLLTTAQTLNAENTQSKGCVKANICAPLNLEYTLYCGRLSQRPLNTSLDSGMQAQHCRLSSSDAEARPVVLPADERLLELRRQYPDHVQLNIRTLDEKNTPIMIPLEGTALELKEEIERRMNVPVQEQRLLFGGRQLRDHKPLSHYGLETGFTVLLKSPMPAIEDQEIQEIVSPAHEVQIFVKHINGKTMAIMVHTTDTVQSLMQKVKEKTGIEPAEQRLLYAGKQLEPRNLLSDYNIEKESNIHLVLRLRGGVCVARASLSGST